MSGGWKITPELNKYWFTMGEIAFHEGFSIEDACPYSSETMPFVQFCAGWHHAKLHTEQESGPTSNAAETLRCPECEAPNFDQVVCEQCGYPHQ